MNDLELENKTLKNQLSYYSRLTTKYQQQITKICQLEGKVKELKEELILRNKIIRGE
jgi:hypothetical protein